MAHGDVGKVRDPWIVILLSIVTIGIYALYWQYATFKEMKDYSGQGIGGGLGLRVARTATVVIPRSEASSSARVASRVLPTPADPTRAAPPQSGSSMARARACSSRSRPMIGQSTTNPSPPTPIAPANHRPLRGGAPRRSTPGPEPAAGQPVPDGVDLPAPRRRSPRGAAGGWP